MSTVPTILVADDDPDIRQTVAELLSLQGYDAVQFDPTADNLRLLQDPYDVVILDLMMPVMDGFTLRESIIRYSPHAQFIIITGQPDSKKLERAMDLGVFMFLTKPFSANHIRYAVLGALRMNELVRKNLEHDILKTTQNMGIIGESPLIVDVRQKICQLAPTDLPVLVTGESGTGKEVVARCVHQYSRRCDQRFTAINCAGLTPTLIESELFGHAQGAFTGATKTKYGFFEVTNGGTLFLDEIGDLPLELQARLLRVLDKGEFTRVGETDVRRTDIRIISATNRNLETMVTAGTFRADLFYRLRGAHIDVAPLRERKTDIPALVAFFLGNDPQGIAPDAMDLLRSFSWPGNIRELKMTIANLKGISPHKIITLESVQNILGLRNASIAAPQVPPSYKEFKKNVLYSAEKRYLETMLQCAKGNIAQAARCAGMDRKNFCEKMKLFEIDK